MFVKYIEDFLTPDECQSIIKLGCSIELMEMKSSLIVNGTVVTENTHYDGNKRLGCYFTDELLELSLLKNLSDKIINQSNEIKPFNNISYVDISKYSFNKYKSGDFLDWHSDSHETLKGATITYIVQLNDDYVGGEVKYKIDDVEYSVTKRAGSVFIFDSNIQHSVDKVKGGIRYSLNVWPSKTIKKSLL